VTLRKRLLAVLGSLVLAVGLGALAVQPAAAAQSHLEIRNSINSRGPIEVFSSLHPNGVIIIVGNGNTFANVDGSVRVDPDPELGGDVDSTHWGLEGQGLGNCISGEGLINPPNETGGRYIKYNTDASGC
jgi:hypothetical protein